MTAQLKAGDFSGLAENYSLYRPHYSKSVLSSIMDYVGKSPSDMTFADVGAGTGIWTRMMSAQGIPQTFAVEPNQDMRRQGIKDSIALPIDWLEGTGEHTGISSASLDLVSMASSFHWVDYEKGMSEFARILKPDGCFVALWNPRYIKINPLLVEIEDKLRDFVPNLKRVSSGNSGITDNLMNLFLKQKGFSDPMYVEGFHTSQLSISEYLGVWWSVNDIRSQAGEKAFSDFMDYVERRIADEPFIETTYRTRAWMIRKI